MHFTHWLAAASVALAVGCAASHGELEPPPLVPRTDPIEPPAPDAGGSSVLCAGVECPEGWACCLIGGNCFDPANRATACPTPSRAGDPDACASSLDCGPGELCAQSDLYCLGAGHCRSTSLCDTTASGPVCGCDGRDYPSICAAERAGVRVSRVARLGRVNPGGARCGEIARTGHPQSCSAEGFSCSPEERCIASIDECITGTPYVACGSDGDCGDGERCCALTGSCMDAACEDCCSRPGQGVFPCREEEDCRPFGLECAGYGCDGTIGCVSTPDCDGEYAPVCACDGRTFTNECLALQEGLRLASAGECAP